MMTSTTTATPTTARSFAESRLFGWMLENGTVWSIMGVRSLLPVPEVIEEDMTTRQKLVRLVKNILLSYASSVIAEVGTVYALAVIDWVFFKHVPYFSKLKRSASPFTWRAWEDWRAGNFMLQLLGGGIALGVLESFWPKWLATELKETPFRFLPFLRNFVIFRVVVDTVFYLAHRGLHVNPWFYEMVHKRQYVSSPRSCTQLTSPAKFTHEHFRVNLRTNWHFSGEPSRALPRIANPLSLAAVDLFVESGACPPLAARRQALTLHLALPIGFGLATLRGLGIKLGRFEVELMQQVGPKRFLARSPTSSALTPRRRRARTERCVSGDGVALGQTRRRGLDVCPAEPDLQDPPPLLPRAHPLEPRAPPQRAVHKLRDHTVDRSAARDRRVRRRRARARGRSRGRASQGPDRPRDLALRARPGLCFALRGAGI
jgi:hypothetical protein